MHRKLGKLIGQSRRRTIAAAGAAVLIATLVPVSASATPPDPLDPRVGLAPGYLPWSEVTSNVDLIDNDPRVAPFDALPAGFAGIAFANSDLAFTGDHAIVGNFNGFQVYNLSEPTNPQLRRSFVCPGGQGDPSVYGNLLFISVEETRGRIDCGPQGAPGTVNLERFRGVRIFDISDIDNPVQLPGVQTCRGSHTHTIVTDPDDPDNIYIYNSGTAGVRSPLELAGCENAALTTAPVTTGNPTQWRIDVIKVPLDAPHTASIVSQPRIFTDPATGAFNGLQNTLPGALHPSGIPYGPLPNTNTCHDITAYPALGVAAGACQGNGILLDITDPVNPVRLDAVSDPNYSYWHSATLSNDASTVIFTDEWGGGTSARCRLTDQLEWGADSFYEVVNGQMEFASYFKMPAVQTPEENCVAHNSSLVPVPGRDILVQAWYQGGMSLIDFSDASAPVEIGYFDRGPIAFPQSPSGLNLGGLWSTYWYNGNVYGTEIARGFDTFELLVSDLLSENELGAAKEYQVEQFNAQHQTQITWAPSFNVAGAYFDQAVRAGTLDERTVEKVGRHLAKAEELHAKGETASAIDQLNNAIRQLGDSNLRNALIDLLNSLS